MVRRPRGALRRTAIVLLPSGRLLCTMIRGPTQAGRHHEACLRAGSKPAAALRQVRFTRNRRATHEDPHRQGDGRRGGVAAARRVVRQPCGRACAIHVGTGEKCRDVEVRGVQLPALLREGQGDGRMGGRPRRDGSGCGQGDEGGPRDGRGGGLERAGARDLHRQGGLRGRNAGHPGARHGHRTSRAPSTGSSG